MTTAEDPDASQLGGMVAACGCLESHCLPPGRHSAPCTVQAAGRRVLRVSSPGEYETSLPCRLSHDATGAHRARMQHPEAVKWRFQQRLEETRRQQRHVPPSIP